MKNHLATRMFALFLALSACAFAQAPSDVPSLVQQAIENQKGRPFWFGLYSVTLRDIPYVYETRVTKNLIRPNGSIERTLSFHSEHIPMAGEVYQRNFGETNPRMLVLQEEQQRRLATLSETERQSRRVAFERRRQERRVMWDEFARAFRFEIAGSGQHSYRPATVVSFNPRPGYHSELPEVSYFRAIRGRLWVDSRDQEIGKMEFEFVTDASYRSPLGSGVPRGTTYRMELAKQIDDRWLPKWAETRLFAPGPAGKTQQFIVEFNNYRKFSVSSDITFDNEPLK